MIKDFTDLIAWQKGHKLALNIYSSTNVFPKSEIFGLASQLRRAAVSATSNIAEGFGRRSNKEKIQFNHIAIGSLTEIQNQLYVAKDLEYISTELFTELFGQTIETIKIIHGLNKHLKSS